MFFSASGRCIAPMNRFGLLVLLPFGEPVWGMRSGLSAPVGFAPSYEVAGEDGEPPSAGAVNCPGCFPDCCTSTVPV